MSEKVKDPSRRRFFSRASEAAGAVVAASVVASVSTAEAAPVDPLPTPSPTPITTVAGDVVWPCQKCAVENVTPAAIFDSVKFGLRCRECAAIQMYRWHLMKFDPNPTDYFKDGKVTYPGHPLMQINDQFGRPKETK